MPERPLLKLPDAEQAPPPRAPRGGSKLIKPGRDRQAARLDSRFDQLSAGLRDEQAIVQIRADPQAIAPERAIVFELAASLADFYQRAEAIGLEYLADDEKDFAPDADFQIEGKPSEDVPGRVYLAMPNVDALRKLLGLWRKYTNNERMDKGFGMWTQLFSLLKNVRAWGPQDRLLPETLIDWQQQLAEAPNDPVRFEVELWFRENIETRAAAFASFAHSVAALGGRILHHATIAEIRYDAALIDLPAARIRELMDDRNVTLASANEIMYIRPQAMAEFPVETELQPDSEDAPIIAAPQNPPVAALLDGFPLQNHARLTNRLSIDDPDDLEQGYVVAARKHGTAMASLIIHGDINRGEKPISRPLHVVPVLRPVQTLDGWEEETPDDRLLVDLIYHAVRRLKEGDGDQPATAPSVLLVNLSLGDSRRPFSGPMSPWARLLDYLAHRYRILFLVSAGNIKTPLTLPQFQGWREFETATPHQRQTALITVMNANKSMRTLFSPAEAMNVITVGAAHRDAAPARNPAMAVDPFECDSLPNMSSALGLGFKRVIKPDILADGGREYVRLLGTNPHLHVSPVRVTGRAFGLLAACPDPNGADLSATAFTWGTSAATALATRAAHLVYDTLMDIEGGSYLTDAPASHHALILKCLLVHGTSWGAAAQIIDGVVDGDGAEHKHNITRFLGYGLLDPARITACTANRATLVGWGEVVPGQAVLHRIPLPQGLDGVREFRAITVTLAWLSPVNPKHQGYRRVALEAGPGGDGEFSLGVTRSKDQPHHQALRKGTLFHERREGTKAAAFVDDGDLVLRVSARATAGEYDQPVPYAVSVSIEVGVKSAIQVYNQVRVAVDERIRPQIRP